LGTIRDARAVPPLIELLASTTSADIHGIAADALGKIRDARAVPPLIELLASTTSADIHGIAADALGKIRDARAVPPLIDLLASTTSDTVRWRTAYALGAAAEVPSADDGDMVINAFRQCKSLENKKILLLIVESFDKTIRQKETVTPFRH